MTRAPETQASPCRITISIGRFSLLLAITIAGLAMAHLVLFFIHFRAHEMPPVLIQLFDLDQRSNLPRWYSWVTFLLTSGFFFVIADVTRRQHDRDAGYWTALAIGFLIMSFDMGASIHQAVNTWVPMATGNHDFTWATPALFLVVLLGIGFVPFLWRLPSRLRWQFLATALIYLIGAVGMEEIRHWWLRARPENHAETLTYSLMTVPHESLQMVGIWLLIVIQLSYLARIVRSELPAAAGTPPLGPIATQPVTVPFRFPARPLLWALIAAAAGIIVADVAIQSWHYRVHELPWLLTDLFDVGEGNNIPSWFAASLMLLASTLLAFISGRSSRDHAPDARRWLTLSLVLALLSLAKDANLPDVFEAFARINWTVPAAVAAIAVGFVFRGFVKRLPASGRRGFVAAGLLYLGGALGMEWLALVYLGIGRYSADSLGYSAIVAGKQTLEMGGMLVLIGTLMTLMSGTAGIPTTIPAELEIAP